MKQKCKRCDRDVTVLTNGEIMEHFDRKFGGNIVCTPWDDIGVGANPSSEFQRGVDAMRAAAMRVCVAHANIADETMTKLGDVQGAARASLEQSAHTAKSCAGEIEKLIVRR